MFNLDDLHSAKRLLDEMSTLSSKNKNVLEPLKDRQSLQGPGNVARSAQERRHVSSSFIGTASSIAPLTHVHALVRNMDLIDKHLNTIGPSSLALPLKSHHKSKYLVTSPPKQSLKNMQNDAKDDSDSESSGDHALAQEAADRQHQAQHFSSLTGPTVYQDGGTMIKGHVDRRGMTPHVVFSATQTPPSELKNSTIACGNPVSCGFCSSTNLQWVLRCKFCGCARMSNAPRLQYLIEMTLSIDPKIGSHELAKRILSFARSDRVASKVEGTFKQAGAVRAKADMMMMNRIVSTLRVQIMRMTFLAWKKMKAFTIQQRANMERIISMQESRMKRKWRQNVFGVWKGYVTRVTNERLQRYQVALQRHQLTKVRRIWERFRSYMHMRKKAKIDKGRRHSDEERRALPPEAQNDIARLKDVQQETLKLVFAAGDSLLDLLHSSLRNTDHSAEQTLHFVQMYPDTAGHYFEATHGKEILERLTRGPSLPQIDAFDLSEKTNDQVMKQLLDQIVKRIDTSSPSESLIQWLNFQRRGNAETSAVNEMSDFDSIKKESADSARSQRSSRTGSIISTRMSLKEKRKEVKTIKCLQDLKAVIASPGVMLKLLCQISSEAQTEYDRIQSTELANTAAIGTDSASSLSPLAQIQLRIYFKLASRVCSLPPDIVTRESFALSDFDSLYVHAVYLYLFHPTESVPPVLPLYPTYQPSFSFLTSLWTKVKTSLLENASDPFAHQIFHLFLTKVKTFQGQFLHFIDICKAIHEIASRHERVVNRDVLTDFSKRVLCKESSVSLALEKETLASSVLLSPAKLLSLCRNEDEMRRIEQIYKENILDLINIFRIYGSKKGISEQEFLKVMTKAGITNKKNILRSHLQLIYQQSWHSSALNSGLTSGLDGEKEVKDKGVSPNEFFEALTRVAYHTNFNQKRRESMAQTATRRTSDLETGSASGSLFQSVHDLVVNKIIPLAKNFQQQGLTFKKQMTYPDVQHVCKNQEKKLKRVFTLYSQKHKNLQSRGKLLDLSDFESLLKDRKLVDTLFPFGKIKPLVAFVQQGGEIGNTTTDVDSDLVYAEFVEAVAAIAVYRNANPYLPFAKKLDTFLDEYFG